MNRQARHERRKGQRNSMTDTETQDTTARMAAPGAPVAPSQAAAKKGASQKRGAPQRPKTPAGRRNKAAPKKKYGKRTSRRRTVNTRQRSRWNWSCAR